MSKKNKNSKTDTTDIINNYLEIINTYGSATSFIHDFIHKTNPVEKHPYEQLGDGFELRPITIVESDDIHNIIENRENFSHLYHNGELVCDKVFRKGGLGGDFKDGYSSLIYYTQKEKHTENKHGFDFGIHVIVNKTGEIVLSGEGISSYPYHSGGNLGKLKDTYYDLTNKTPILTANGSSTINSKHCVIVEHRYGWYNKELPLGIYKIDKNDCSVVKIDDIN